MTKLATLLLPLLLSLAAPGCAIDEDTTFPIPTVDADEETTFDTAPRADSHHPDTSPPPDPSPDAAPAPAPDSASDSVTVSDSGPDSVSDSVSDSGSDSVSAPDSLPPRDALPDADASPHDAHPDSDSSPPAASFTSDPPGLYWVDVSPTTSRGLTLLSTRFVEDDAGTRFHQECLAEVRNDGAATLCGIAAHASLKDGDEMERAGFTAFVDGPSFDVGASSSAPCLAPGAHGAFFATADVDEPVGPETVRSVEIAFTSIVSIAHAHAATPTIDWMTAEHVASKYFKLVGIASAAPALAVHDVVLHAYPLVGGVLRSRLVATHPSSLVPGSSWTFATTWSDAAFAEARVFGAFDTGA